MIVVCSPNLVYFLKSIPLNPKLIRPIQASAKAGSRLKASSLRESV